MELAEFQEAFETVKQICADYAEAEGVEPLDTKEDNTVNTDATF